MLNKIHPYYYLSALYIIASLVLGMILRNFLVIFLGWNMVLSTLVFFLSQVLMVSVQKKTHLSLVFIILGLYVLFFPNSLYILTDFIHIQNYTFFSDYPDIYEFDISNWWVFMHISIGALYAVKLGMSSIHNLEPIAKPVLHKFYYLILSLLFLLSSTGIYIGRFLRFNSWNILRIFDILNEIFSNVSFFFGFILIFFILHWVSYFLFSNLVLKGYNKYENKYGGIK